MCNILSVFLLNFYTGFQKVLGYIGFFFTAFSNIFLLSFYTGFQKELGFKVLGFNKIWKKYSVRYSVGLFYYKSTRFGLLGWEKVLGFLLLGFEKVLGFGSVFR